MFGYRLPINGDDVINEFGIEPGPIIKEILKQVMNNVYSNPDISRESCLKLMKQAYKNVLKQKQ